jgi:hypothetical protein
MAPSFFDGITPIGMDIAATGIIAPAIVAITDGGSRQQPLRSARSSAALLTEMGRQSIGTSSGATTTIALIGRRTIRFSRITGLGGSADLHLAELYRR